MRILVVTQHFWPENFRINDIVEGFVQDGLSVDVLCGLPNYPKGEWFDGYSADGPFEEVYKGARVFRAREIPRKEFLALLRQAVPVPDPEPVSQLPWQPWRMSFRHDAALGWLPDER